MARPISDEELQLRKRARRRLIGAIVLVTVVVVALPMVLDSEPKPVSQDINIRIPSSDSETFTSKVVPVTPAPESKPAPKLPATVTEKPATTPIAESKAPKTPASAPAAKPEATGATKETAKQAEEAQAAQAAAETQAPREAGKKTGESAGQFVVQVIALADAQKARQMQQRISAAGIKSYTEVVKAKKGDVTRVRAGPFATREAAEEARAQLKTIELDGKVIPK
jgi:DedD protein